MPNDTFKIESVNIGSPVKVSWRGKMISTGTFKSAVEERIPVGWLNLEGDRQADLQVHGGRDKAIYAYACEHYEYWKKELPTTNLPWGAFGENLTVSGGLYENEICIGDRFRLGTAEIVAVQPRLPCYKLGIRFGTQTMVRHFLKAERYGIYFRVVQQGNVQRGDSLELLSKPARRMSILALARVLTTDTRRNTGVMEEALHLDALPVRLREYFQGVLSKQHGRPAR